jgi:hypothetical protein
MYQESEIKEYLNLSLEINTSINFKDSQVTAWHERWIIVQSESLHLLEITGFYIGCLSSNEQAEKSSKPKLLRNPEGLGSGPEVWILNFYFSSRLQLKYLCNITFGLPNDGRLAVQNSYSNTGTKIALRLTYSHMLVTSVQSIRFMIISVNNYLNVFDNGWLIIGGISDRLYTTFRELALFRQEDHLTPESSKVNATHKWEKYPSLK